MKFNFKLVVKVVALVLFVGFFIPTFAVACDSKTISVSAANAMTGIKDSYLGKVSEAQPVLILLALLPLAILVLAFIGQKVKYNTEISAGLAVVDIIAWFVFKSKVKAYATDNGCEYSTKIWFCITILLLLVIIAICILAKIGKIDVEKEITADDIKSISGNTGTDNT